tara:strand:+ start:54 stop:608 length:555 start_codon:yes stop_codon:yes gene_type:complete
MYSAAIPGQSLTNEPKNAPWENPPQFADPVDALKFHMDKLRKPKNMKAAVNLLQLGLDVVTMTQGILRNGVSQGRHTIDTSILIAPVIHEYITGVADASGIDYQEGLEEEEGPGQEEVMYSVRTKQAEKILADLRGKKKIDLTPMQDSLEETSMPTVEEEMPIPEMEEAPMTEQPKGLMARRTA